VRRKKPWPTNKHECQLPDISHLKDDDPETGDGDIWCCHTCMHTWKVVRAEMMESYYWERRGWWHKRTRYIA
jgi:hypothetical protein